MPRTPDPLKRDRILELAILSFCEKGYKETSIKEIADAAGVAPGTVYTYFKDKRELYYACINQIWTNFFEDLNACLSEEPDVFHALKRGHDLASDNVWKSHILVYDMFTNKIRRNILKANLLRTAQILTNYFNTKPDGLAATPTNPEVLTQKIEVFLFGAFFQLALSEKEEFQEFKEKQFKSIISILQGEF